MMSPFLTPLRRMSELVIAAYGAGFGLFVWGHGIAGHSALRWASLDLSEGVMVGQIMATAGMIHALGIWINGRWNWSPFLRLAGLAVHLVVLMVLTELGTSAKSTAGYTYAYILTGFIVVASFVVRDCVAAIDRRRAKWKHN